MGSNISQAYNARQYIYNNVVQSSKENCVISCTNNSSDFLVLLDNVNIKGNVDFSQYCGIQGATCLLKSYIDSNINNVINSIAQQTQIAEADIFAIDFSKYNQSVNVNQQIVNNVTQVSSASCQQSVDNSNSNNVFIAVDSSIGGNLNLSQRGDINNVTCSLNNMISNQVSNSETSKSTQSIIKGSVILFAIIAIIIAVALFCFLIFIIFSLKAVMKETKTDPQPGIVETTQSISPLVSALIDSNILQGYPTLNRFLGN